MKLDEAVRFFRDVATTLERAGEAHGVDVRTAAAEQVLAELSDLVPPAGSVQGTWILIPEDLRREIRSFSTAAPQHIPPSNVAPRGPALAPLPPPPATYAPPVVAGIEEPDPDEKWMPKPGENGDAFGSMPASVQPRPVALTGNPDAFQKRQGTFEGYTPEEYERKYGQEVNPNPFGDQKKP